MTEDIEHLKWQFCEFKSEANIAHTITNFEPQETFAKQYYHLSKQRNLNSLLAKINYDFTKAARHPIYSKQEKLAFCYFCGDFSGDFEGEWPE